MEGFIKAAMIVLFQETVCTVGIISIAAPGSKVLGVVELKIFAKADCYSHEEFLASEWPVENLLTLKYFIMFVFIKNFLNVTTPQMTIYKNKQVDK